jgi:23S rRNA pseudouridine1911/1915/1917 synthase
VSALRRVRVVVPRQASGLRLDRFLATLPEVGTRAQAKQAIDAGRVRVMGVEAKPALALRAGQQVVLIPAPVEPSEVRPEAVPLVVLYEDDQVIAVDKPPGMVTHPAPGARRGSMVAALLHRLGVLPDSGVAERPGVVHRLDRDTSGVLLVARTPHALATLGRQFRERTIAKRYLALVIGRVSTSAGVVEWPIGRHPRERKRMSIHTRRGRAAVTHYEVLERLRGATLLALRPETGRTHQLRVHLAALGHPIVGDRVYGRSGRASRLATPADGILAAFPRQALHAAEIRFAHPATGEPVHVRAPLPPDLVALLGALRGLGADSV